ncbi:MAG: putative bifunctional diguanylate cyclase/phosphodiesterase [Cyanobium sp.]
MRPSAPTNLKSAAGRLGIGGLLLVVTAGTLGLSQVLQDQMARHLIDKLLDTQTQRIQERVSRFDGTLHNAELSVRRYATLLSAERLSPTPPAALFERTFQRDADGSWRVPRGRFDPHQDANAWIPPDVPLTDANKRFYLRALDITRSFGLGSLREPLENTWMLPLINGMTAFWPAKPDYLYDAASNLSYLQTPWVTLTDPKVNPGRVPRWVGPEYDPAARDWSISVVMPFFRNGVWAGSVGHDMVVSRLLRHLIGDPAAGVRGLTRPLFAASRNGDLLAKPGGVPKPGERLPDRYRAILARPQNAGELQVVADGGHYLVVAAIPTLGAKVFYRVDGDWLRQSVGKELVGLQLGQGLFVLVAVGSVAAFAVKDSQARRQQQALLETRNRDLKELARRDQLTTLPNRLGLLERAREALGRARRNGSDLLVVFLDLDRFKLVNDSLGHDSGDLLLQAVAERLNGTVRASDTVARLGGDEFVLIIEDLDDQFDAGHFAEKLHRAFAEPLSLNDQPMAVSPSIGVSIFPDDGDDIETLMRKADLAMYEVKSHGRNGWLFFTESMNEAVQERLQLERDIRTAIEGRQFSLHYQPQWQIDGSRLTGWEALLRWQHPQRGAIAPDVFIPVAEETGMIQDLGAMVLLEACREAVRWQVEGIGRFSVSVNLSVRQFDLADLTDFVERALQETGLEPELLELEITESVMMDDTGRTQQLLNQLRLRGIRVAIDDFGTGYSSLSYLSALPIDRLKIDKSFVASSFSDANSAVIIEAVISLARSLGMSTIAEGVESEAQRRFLRQQGCEQIQGYLMGRPMPAEAIAAFVQGVPV